MNACLFFIRKKALYIFFQADGMAVPATSYNFATATCLSIAVVEHCHH